MRALRRELVMSALVPLEVLGIQKSFVAYVTLVRPLVMYPMFLLVATSSESAQNRDTSKHSMH